MGIIPPRFMSLNVRANLSRKERFAALADDLMKCATVLQSKTLAVLSEEAQLLGPGDD